jgi:hypothetical protein
MERKYRRQFVSSLRISAFVLASIGATVSGCSVNESDVKRWGQTEHGPDKLAAVFTHDKYDQQLRVEAGLELLRMKPRSGRRIGISRLVDCLAQLSPEERKKLIDAMLPEILKQMKAPPPTAPAGQPVPPDQSYAYKDAAMAMLTYDKAVLVSDEASRKQLTEALIDWSQHDFEHRLDNTTQMFGLEQMMRTVGAPAVKGLPALINENAKYDRIASLVAELGEQQTKQATAAKLVDLAKSTGSQAWLDKTKPQIEEANKASKLNPTPEQLKKQLEQYQEEALTKIFASIKKVGTKPAIDYCISVASDKTLSEKRRQAALAAIEGRLDRNSPAEIEKVMALAAADLLMDEALQEAAKAEFAAAMA